MQLDQRELLKKNVFIGREARTSLLFSIQNVFDQFFYTQKRKIRNIPAKTTFYLNNLLKKNEKGKNLRLNFKYFIYSSNEAIFFVSPKGEVLISRGLIKSFIQTEAMLKVLLVECYLRHRFGVYNYKEFPPTWYKEAAHLSKILIVGPDDKKRLNNWVYQLLKMNGTDTNVLLDWAQVKNRNSSLAYYIAPPKSLSLKEEQQIKEYLLENGIYNELEELESQSKLFFKFKREFR